MEEGEEIRYIRIFLEEEPDGTKCYFKVSLAVNVGVTVLWNRKKSSKITVLDIKTQIGNLK